MGHLPFRSVTLRPLLSQSLPFSYCNIIEAQTVPSLKFYDRYLAFAPNHLWSQYDLCCALDLFNREIIGWSIKEWMVRAGCIADGEIPVLVTICEVIFVRIEEVSMPAIRLGIGL